MQIFSLEVRQDLGLELLHFNEQLHCWRGNAFRDNEWPGCNKFMEERKPMPLA